MLPGFAGSGRAAAAAAAAVPLLERGGCAKELDGSNKEEAGDDVDICGAKDFVEFELADDSGESGAKDPVEFELADDSGDRGKGGNAREGRDDGGAKDSVEFDEVDSGVKNSVECELVDGSGDRGKGGNARGEGGRLSEGRLLAAVRGITGTGPNAMGLWRGIFLKGGSEILRPTASLNLSGLHGSIVEGIPPSGDTTFVCRQVARYPIPRWAPRFRQSQL